MSNIALTHNAFYDCFVYNNTSQQIPASNDDALLFPIVSNSDDYNVAICKAKIDLSTIPLTQSNIPLKKYQVGLKIGNVEALAYVHQVNSNTNNYVYNCSQTGVITKYQYSATGQLIVISTLSLSQYFTKVIQMIVDDNENYYLSGNTNGSSIGQYLKVFDKNGILLSTLQESIKCISMDRLNNLYVATDNSILIYSTLNIATQVLNLIATITSNFAKVNFQSIHTVCADIGFIVGYNTNEFTVFNDSFIPMTDFIEAGIKQLGKSSSVMNESDRFVIVDNGTDNDIIFGMPTTNPNSVVNVLTGNQYVAGQYLSAPCIVSDQTFGFGVGELDSATYAFALVNGVPSNPFMISLTQMSYLASNNQNSIYGVHNGALYAMNVNSANNQWYLLSNNNIFNAFDINPSTGKLYGVDNNLSNLFVSNYSVQPRQIFAKITADSTNIHRIDVGYPVSSQFNTFNVFQKSISDANSQTIGMYRYHYDVNSYGMLIVQSGTTNRLLFCDMNLDVNNEVVIAEPQNPIKSICKLNHTSLYGYCAVNDGTQHIYFYDESTGLMTTSITVPDVVSSVGYLAMASFLHPTLGSILAVGNGTKLYLYQFAQNMTSTLIFNNNYHPYLNDVDIFSLEFRSDGSLYLLTAFTSTHPEDIWVSTFDANYTQLASTNSVFSGLVGSLPYFNTLQIQENLKELYIAYATHLSVINYEVVSPQIIGTISITIGFDLTHPPVYYSLPSSDLMYTYSQIQSSQPINGIAFSRTSPTKLYISNTAGNIFYGYLSANITFTQIENVQGTYNTISSVPNTGSAIYESVLYGYTLSNQQLIKQVSVGNNYVSGIARNDIDKTFTMANQSNSITSYNALDFSQNFQTNLATANTLVVKNGEDIESGNISIYNMQVLIDAINDAFTLATTRINAQSSGILSEAPVLTLNYQSGLCTLTFPSILSQVGNGMLMNTSLHNLINFYSTIDSISQLYIVVLSPTQTAVTQTSKSIYRFNQLDKILFQSNTIYVTGAFFSTNQSNKIITDIDVPISEFVENIGEPLEYQPNFLRPYSMNSNLPLSRIQLDILYQYRDGTQYTLLLNPDQNYSVKLTFIKLF